MHVTITLYVFLSCALWICLVQLLRPEKTGILGSPLPWRTVYPSSGYLCEIKNSLRCFVPRFRRTNVSSTITTTSHRPDLWARCVDDTSWLNEKRGWVMGWKQVRELFWISVKEVRSIQSTLCTRTGSREIEGDRRNNWPYYTMCVDWSTQTWVLAPSKIRLEVWKGPNIVYFKAEKACGRICNLKRWLRL